ncbi:hypothetical protein [Alloactinosynnema sp. L-07]|nr:hypothetical protein [Alloactinosynnema sp. L-07]
MQIRPADHVVKQAQLNDSGFKRLGQTFPNAPPGVLVQSGGLIVHQPFMSDPQWIIGFAEEAANRYAQRPRIGDDVLVSDRTHTGFEMA